MLKSVLLPMTVVAVTATAAAMTARQDEKVVPVHQEPRHHLVFDSDAIRVLDIQITPGDTTLFHTHSNPILYVNMSASLMRNQVLGRDWGGEGTGGQQAASTTNATAPGPPRTTPTVAGVPPAVFGRLMSSTSYAKQPLTHRVNNAGTTLYRLIGVINRTDGDPRTEPSPDFASKAELDNPWFRGYRWPLQTPTPEHRHANPVVIVLVRGRAVVTAAKDVPLDTLGSFSFIEGGVAHSIKGVRADGVEPNEIVEIEVRKPRS